MKEFPNQSRGHKNNRSEGSVPLGDNIFRCFVFTVNENTSTIHVVQKRRGIKTKKADRCEKLS